MQNVQGLSRAELALLEAQRCNTEIVFSRVTNRLRSEPCVAFAFACDVFQDWSPETDVAVRMLSIATRGRSIDHGQLISELERTLITPATIESGLRAVDECVEMLKSLHQPFEFLAHVEGQTSLQVHCYCDDGNLPLSQLADALANEARSLRG